MRNVQKPKKKKMDNSDLTDIKIKYQNRKHVLF